LYNVKIKMVARAVTTLVVVFLSWTKQCVASDSCSTYLGCGSCVTSPGCGWCSGVEGERGSCIAGVASGPVGADDYQNVTLTLDPLKDKMHQLGCQDWHFSFCPGTSCSQYNGCTKCISDPFCGWCSTSATCTEGILEGPIAGLGDGCKVGYAHAPAMPDASARSIEALVSSAEIAAEGLRLGLHEMCEAADKLAEEHLEHVQSEQETINATLNEQIQTCAPCGGDWPMCECEGEDMETNNVDLTYRPGSIYVRVVGDEAASAAITGGATGPAMTPEEAGSRAAARVAAMRARSMSAYMSQYVEAIKALARARSLKDEAGIADAELAAEQAKAMLSKAKTEASEAASVASDIFSTDDMISDLDAQFDELSKVTAAKSRAMVSGDMNAKEDAETREAELKGAIRSAQEIAAAANKTADGPTAAEKTPSKTEERESAPEKSAQKGQNETKIQPDSPEEMAAKESSYSDADSELSGASYSDTDSELAGASYSDTLSELAGASNAGGALDGVGGSVEKKKKKKKKKGSDWLRFAAADSSTSKEEISADSVRKILRQIVSSRNVAGAQQALQALEAGSLHR